MPEVNADEPVTLLSSDEDEPTAMPAGRGGGGGAGLAADLEWPAGGIAPPRRTKRHSAYKSPSERFKAFTSSQLLPMQCSTSAKGTRLLCCSICCSIWPQHCSASTVRKCCSI